MTVYQLAKAVERLGVSEQAVYRLARHKGAPQRFDARLLAALCAVLGIKDMNELLTLKPVGVHAPSPAPPLKKPARRKRTP